jgi:hypothetical protein
MKVVINEIKGGFGLSDEAWEEWLSRKGIQLVTKENQRLYELLEDLIPRDDRDLVDVVNEMEDSANALYAKLFVAEVPEFIKWEVVDIGEGREMIEAKSRK